MDEETFDIFSGDPEEQGLWIEAIAGLSNARRRMAQISEDTPGKYFLFSGASQRVLSRTRTLRESRISGLTGVFCTSGSEREFTLEGKLVCRSGNTSRSKS